MNLRYSLAVAASLAAVAAPKSKGCAAASAVSADAGAAAEARIIDRCHAAIQLPSRFTVVAPERVQDVARFVDDAGAEVVVSCVEKSAAMPLAMPDRAELAFGPGYVEETATPAAPSSDNDDSDDEDLSSAAVVADAGGNPSSPGRTRPRAIRMADVDGRPVFAQRREALGGGMRAALMLTQRARYIYWIRYQAPVDRWFALERERARVLRSFHVTDAVPDATPGRYWHHEILTDGRSLRAARALHRATEGRRATPVPSPGGGPPSAAGPYGERVFARGETGPLAIYLARPPGPLHKRPTLVWLHAGFDGPRAELWATSRRSWMPRHEALGASDVVLAAASWRGEFGNPGGREVFFGEAQDVVQIVERVRQLPDVDPDNVYLAGDDTGGTLGLLALELGARVQAAFITDGRWMDPIGNVPASLKLPFDPKSPEEIALRSPGLFYRQLGVPTFYFGGTGSVGLGDAQYLEDLTAQSTAPVLAYEIQHLRGADLGGPISELIGKKIHARVTDGTPIAFTRSELDELRVPAAELGD